MHHTKQAKCNIFLRDLCNGTDDDAISARAASMLLLQAGFSERQIKLSRLYFGLESVRQGNVWYWKPWEKTPKYNGDTPAPEEGKRKPIEIKRR